MKKSAMLSLRIIIALTCIITTSSGWGAQDKWGGDDRVKNPYSKYHTGTATATGPFTLTDASKSWPVNSLAGSILQPNTGTEVYFLIKANTSNQITVYGSSTVGSEEESVRLISAENTGTQSYAILDRWSVQKVNYRWWLFDPYGNSYWAKSVNDFGVIDTRIGNSIDAVYFTTLMNNHPLYGGNGTNAGGYTGNIFKGVVDIVKSTGFNTLGATIDASYTVPGSCYNPYGGTKTATRFMPFISQVRVSSLNNANTTKFTVNGANIADAYDADFQTDLATDILNGNSGSSAATEGYRLFDVFGCTSRGSWASYHLTPYKKAKYNIPANPYFIGYDWDEEPKYLQSENTNEHMGYRIFISAAGTDRKTAALAVLQKKYATVSALNAAWGAAYADWAGIGADTGTVINTVLSNEPYCRYWLEQNSNALIDLNLIAEDFWRTYTLKVHDALDSLTAVHVLNYGPGYHGWTGASKYSFYGTSSPEYLFRGSVSLDRSKAYVDIIEIGDPLHGAHTSITPDFYENMGKDLKDRYAFHGRPYHHESSWLTAEADSAVAQTGTITGLTAKILTDTSAHFDGVDVSYPPYAYGTTAPRRMLLIDPASNPPGSRSYYSVCVGPETGSSCPNPSVTETDINVRYKIEDSNWAWNSSTVDMTTSGAVGKPYVFVAHDAFGQISAGNYPLYIPLTQEDRGTMYAKFVNDAASFKANNGDGIIVGFSQWTWFDFSFKSTASETRNFGFMTIKGNLYDGSATIANGEVQDCGDFVTPVRSALTNLYDLIIGAVVNSPNPPPPPPTGVIIFQKSL